MSVRLVAIVTELVLAALVTGWGITTVARPELWHLRPVRWWVGWTDQVLGRSEGVGVAMAGVGMAMSGLAAALATPTPTLPPPVRVAELTGLGLLVVATVFLAVVHPTDVLESQATPEPDVAVGGAVGSSLPAVLTSGDTISVRGTVEAPV